MRTLIPLLMLLPFHASAFTILECVMREGAVTLHKERSWVNEMNQAMVEFPVYRGIQFKGYSLDHFVVVYAESELFQVNTTGNLSSFLVVYNPKEENKDLSVNCELDPPAEEPFGP